jgi:hypothetical protein
MQSTASQMDLACTDLDEEQDRPGLQPQGFHREAITGQQLVPMLA